MILEKRSAVVLMAMVQKFQISDKWKVTLCIFLAVSVLCSLKNSDNAIYDSEEDPI